MANIFEGAIGTPTGKILERLLKTCSSAHDVIAATSIEKTDSRLIKPTLTNSASTLSMELIGALDVVARRT